MWCWQRTLQGLVEPVQQRTLSLTLTAEGETLALRLIGRTRGACSGPWHSPSRSSEGRNAEHWPGNSVHSLKYIIGRHWLRSHATLLTVAAVIVAIVVYFGTR